MLSVVSGLSGLAASDIHISLKAEHIFTVGPLAVTNSYIYGLISAILLGFLLVLAAKRITITPKKGFTQIIEMITEMVVGVLEAAFGSRSKAIKYAPIFGVYFFFIFFVNILGTLPVVGTNLYADIGGVHTPLLRPFTADLNGTIAMAVIAIVTVQILSIRVQGFKGHFRHYFTDKPLNPINFFIGILEVFGELTRVLSLSLRLFLNTAVGEILIAVFTSMIISSGRTPLAVIPILLFEVLVAGIQAYVFTVLAATYLALSISHADEHHNEHHDEATAKLVEGSASHGV